MFKKKDLLSVSTPLPSNVGDRDKISAQILASASFILDPWLVPLFDVRDGTDSVLISNDDCDEVLGIEVLSTTVSRLRRSSDISLGIGMAANGAFISILANR